jgi:Protein of unknown function (DUF2827)
MRIGISIITQKGWSIWSNGIGQNIFFLAEALSNIPFVEQVVLIDCGTEGHYEADTGQLGHKYPIIKMAETPDSLDIVIELHGVLNDEWVRRYRARGGKLVYYVCGHPYAGMVDPTTFGKSCYIMPAERVDEVWLFARDVKFENYVRDFYRAPVKFVPYLWHHDFIQHSVADVRAHGHNFGYDKKPSDPHRVAIFEPNISPSKMGIIPLLICEQVERSHPEVLECVNFLNSKHFEEHLTFTFMRKSLEINKGKLNIFAREIFAAHMALRADVVVSHQLEWNQNYLYFDALYGGYPLVHNSPLFSDIGYYYPDSDIEKGAAALHTAITQHENNRASYEKSAQAKFVAHSPYAENNQSAYARLLLSLTEKRSARHD